MVLSKVRVHQEEEDRRQDRNETVYKNGREVKVKNYTPEDKVAEEVGLSTDARIKKRFSLWPTKTLDGNVWLQFYWSFSTEEDYVGLHSGTYYKTWFRTASLSGMKQECMKAITV